MFKSKINFLLKWNVILLGVFILYFIINFGGGFEVVDELFDTKLWFNYIFSIILIPILLAKSFFPAFFIFGTFNMLCVSLIMKLFDFLNEGKIKIVLMYILVVINIILLLGLLFYFGLWCYVMLIIGAICNFIICIIIFIVLIIYLILIIKKCFFK